jgi:hypothetical protein
MSACLIDLGVMSKRTSRQIFLFNLIDLTILVFFVVLHTLTGKECSFRV